MFPGPGKRKRHVGDPRVMFIPQDRMMELRDLSGKGVSYDDAGKLSVHVSKYFLHTIST